MKRLATGVTLVSLIAISVLGFFAMHSMQGSQCITETASRAACPENDAFAAIGFHVQAWQDISIATLQATVTGFGIILLALALIFFATAGPVQAIRAAIVLRSLALVPTSSRAAELRWLAFHLNSPNAS
jgi:hypothetical protein